MAKATEATGEANKEVIQPQRIDLENEQVFLLSEGPKRVGKSEDRLRNYINAGYHVDNDKSNPRCFLGSCQLPAGRATSVEAYRRFLIDINTDPSSNGSDAG